MTQNKKDKQKVPNEEFKKIFEKIWPKIEGCFPDKELQQKIEMFAKNAVSKSSVTNYKSKKASNRMFEIIENAIINATCNVEMSKEPLSTNIIIEKPKEDLKDIIIKEYIKAQIDIEQPK